jgi:hypothetical protein
MGTMRGREGPIIIKGQYALNWTPYSRVKPDRGDFHCLLLTVSDLHEEVGDRRQVEMKPNILPESREPHIETFRSDTGGLSRTNRPHTFSGEASISV